MVIRARAQVRKSVGARLRHAAPESTHDFRSLRRLGPSAWRVAQLFRRALEAWFADYAPSMGAAIAYYTLFSVAPLLLIVISVAGLLFDPGNAQNQLVLQLRSLIGDAGADAIRAILVNAADPQKSGAAALIGFLALVFGATSVVSELQSSLDRIWRVAPTPRVVHWWAFVRARLLSMSLILGIGFLLMVSLALSTALSALSTWWQPLFGSWYLPLTVINFAVSFAVVTFLFAMIYKVLPRVRVSWRDVTTGAVVTALLFEIGKQLIGYYLGRSGITSVFGAAGSLAVLLLWVYYSAQVFLLGAEFTWVYAHDVGSLRKASPSHALRAPVERWALAAERRRRQS